MSRLIGLILAASIFSAPGWAADATIHGENLHKEGAQILIDHFDLTLDGRLITAVRAVYHSDTGVIDLNGAAHVQFGKGARSFPGEVH